MASRRSLIQQYYGLPVVGRSLTELQKFSAGQADPFDFHGPAISQSVVTRTDLNGYSDWIRGKSFESRVSLLDDFFSKVVPLLALAGGVFFRDEGDCIVALFTDYFPGVTHEQVERFCMAASGETYGTARLTAKTVLSCGQVAFFQKAHEAGTEEWSAEGTPFVRANRLEGAAPSRQVVVFFREDYDLYFKDTNMSIQGSTNIWTVKYDRLQIEGLGLPGGWADVVLLER